MQFTIVALLSLVAVAFAGPMAIPQRLDGMSYCDDDDGRLGK